MLLPTPGLQRDRFPFRFGVLTMNNDLASLEALFLDIAATQRGLVEAYTATGQMYGVDFIRGYAAAFEKAAEIVAERVTRATKES